MVSLIVRQRISATIAELLQEDDEIRAWWGTWIECAVALSRLKREDLLDEESVGNARARLDRLAKDWTEVRPTDDLRLLVSLLSKYHPLKAADALQLAAALRWCEGRTPGSSFVCLGNQLRRAASEQGFDVLSREFV